MLTFDEAFELIENVHKSAGDANGWNFCKPEARNAVQQYPKYDVWHQTLFLRSDVSDDDRWEYDVFCTSFAVLFALLGKR